MFLRYNLLGLGWALMILLLLILPSKNLLVVNLILFVPFDVFVHCFLFGVLCYLLIVGFKKQYSFRVLRYNSIVSAILIVALYGTIIEVIQGVFIITRSFEIKDILANFMGCTIGTLLFSMIYNRI